VAKGVFKQAKRRRRAYGTHIESVAEFSESWGAEIAKMVRRIAVDQNEEVARFTLDKRRFVGFAPN
jgi:hypothetical protein